MWWETERSWGPGVPPPSLVPLSIGLVLGLLAMTATPFVYYWLFMPVLPAVLGVAFVFLGVISKRLLSVAEGLFAATLFGVLFVVVALAGLSSSG